MDSRQNPMVSDVVIPAYDKLVQAGKVPSISLHLLVKNGESCVGRLIDNVGPYIREVVAVVNDTTDGTIGILKQKCDWHNLELLIIPVTHENHPEFYILDVPETYTVGKPLECEEEMKGPFTGKPLLADWAGVRNLGWSQCRGEWRLFMDADDVMEDPASIPGICLIMEEKGIDMVTARYVFGRTPTGRVRSDALRERIARNVPSIRWEGRTHEILKGQRLTAHIEGNLRVVDMKDSTGDGIRLPGRCLKVLYHEGRNSDWQVSDRTLLYLGMEAKEVMPELARTSLELYLARADCTHKEERAWARVMLGEIFEHEGDYNRAARHYRESLEEYPGAKAAFRLCYALFRYGDWDGSIKAYEQGVANGMILQLIESGEVFEDACAIFVSASYEKMGKPKQALDFCNKALRAFPNNRWCEILKKELEKQIYHQRV